MDTDAAVQAEMDKNDGVKKPPRKPRPSEIAAKKAKAVKGKKKPTGRRLAAEKNAVKKRKAAKNAKSGVVRCERMDLRLTKPEKAKIMARVKKTKRTVTSVVMEAVHKAKW